MCSTELNRRDDAAVLAADGLEARIFEGAAKVAAEREMAAAFFERWQQVPPPAFPIWDGKTSLRGKSLLVKAGADLGGEIAIFGRLRELDAERIIWEGSKRLAPLFRRSDPRVSVVEAAPITGVDYMAGALNLFPRAPLPSRYLAADPARVRHYRAMLPRGPLVGLAWRSAADTFARRSIPVAELRPLASLAATFVCLQYGDTDSDIAALRQHGLNIVKPAGWDALASLDDAAALTEVCDCVAMIPHTGAHIAAALGKTVYLLNPFYTRGHWECTDGRSVLYPTVRELRQARPGEWGPAMCELQGRLAA